MAFFAFFGPKSAFLAHFGRRKPRCTLRAPSKKNARDFTRTFAEFPRFTNFANAGTQAHTRRFLMATDSHCIGLLICSILVQFARIGGTPCNREYGQFSLFQTGKKSAREFNSRTARTFAEFPRFTNFANANRKPPSGRFLMATQSPCIGLFTCSAFVRFARIRGIPRSRENGEFSRFQT